MPVIVGGICDGGRCRVAVPEQGVIRLAKRKPLDPRSWTSLDPPSEPQPSDTVAMEVYRLRSIRIGEETFRYYAANHMTDLEAIEQVFAAYAGSNKAKP